MAPRAPKSYETKYFASIFLSFLSASSHLLKGDILSKGCLITQNLKLKMLQFIQILSPNLRFLPAAKRHGQGKVWVGIVLLLLWTIVSLVCFSFIFAMCVGILGQHGTVPKLSRSLACNFYLQILLVFQNLKKKISSFFLIF